MGHDPPLAKSKKGPDFASPLTPRDHGRSGFTLVELLIVTMILGLLATLAIPKIDAARQRAYDAAALTDLKNASFAIEEYFTNNFTLPSEDQLLDSGFVLSPGVSFTTYGIRDAGSRALQRVHIHIEHVGSVHYYHQEYPSGVPPEKRPKT